ncbi:hypothetical protein [Saccharothrix luteola]|uniref:hypothetical protein n=1 Tax=Saccharothrix luteola TaxID=2893018 RepID=UPI001E58B1B0|nr:hypothetical protein [Saccharothrix luteola]MCC8243341.1 hypothetical protein [Saccharothrix luteola]
MPHTPNRPFDGPPPQRQPDTHTPTPRRDPDTQLPPRRDPDGVPAQRRDPEAWTPPHRDPDPNTPHTDSPDPDRHNSPDGDRPSIDEAHARHGETTPAGISHHRGDPDMGDLPHRVPPDPRYFTADVHITPDGRARIGNHTCTPEQYGDLLRRNGWDGRTPIRLIGCDAGTNDFANRLARHTDADVLAPTKPAWTDSNGRVYTSDATTGPDGNRHPKIPPNGEWHTHRPDGTTTRTSEDGFVPGTKDADKHDLDPTDAKDRAARPGDRETPTHQDIDWKEPKHTRSEDVTVDQREPFYDPPQHDRPLEPNTRYRIHDDTGHRTTVYTDGGTPPRITHVDAHTPDTRIGTDANPFGNADAIHPRPDTDYRVHTGGDPFTFRTDADGRPRFDLDDFGSPKGPDYEPGGMKYRSETLAHDPNQRPFSDRTDLEPDCRYEVTRRTPEGHVWHGTFFTSPELKDGKSQFTHIETWTDKNPELGNKHTMRDPYSPDPVEAPRVNSTPDPVTGRRVEGLPLAETRFQTGTTVYHTDTNGVSSIAFTPDYGGTHVSRDTDVQTPSGKHGEMIYGDQRRGGHLQDHASGGGNEAINQVSQLYRENNLRRPGSDAASRYKDSWAQVEKDRRAAVDKDGIVVERVRVFSAEASQGRVPDRLYVVEQRLDPSTGRTSYHFRSSPNV